MGLLCRKISKHRLLIGTTLSGAVICWTLISLMDRWTPQNAIENIIQKQVNDLSSLHVQVTEDMEQRWEVEYENRVQKVRDECAKDEIVAMRRVWRVATNRRFGKESHCKNKMCPIILDEQKVLFFCFIPQVASLTVKKFFLNISDISMNATLATNDTAFHVVADNALRRISPMFYPSTTVNRFFKIIFVRHPFDRLVSAFRSKAERPRKEISYFYEKYWYPIMKKLRPEGSVTKPITFAEFVWYLIHTPERDYDDHWAPYWSRCDPCLVDYDFIGKLETAQHDFPYAFRKVGIESRMDYWKNIHPHHHSLTIKYFATVPEEQIMKLYNIYKFDFELFGYSIKEFLPLNTTIK